MIYAFFVAVLIVLVGIIYRLYKEWQRTSTLLNIGLQLSSTMNRKALLKLIMETTAKTMQAEGSSIILVDEEKDELYFEVAVGDKQDEIQEIRLKSGEGVAGWVASTGKPVLISDAAKDPRWSNRVSSKVNVPTRNMLCVPVISNQRTLGVLQVINKMNGRSFHKRDLRLLEMMASPISIALENMLLYEALLKSMETLRETTAAKERLESELKIAQEIQMSFLPGHTLQKHQVTLFASLTPAREVGGDLYHFVELDDHKLLICLGDVSDKGMPAALFMSGLMIWIQAKASAERSPSEILQAINREISSEDSTMFATLFLAILDTRTGQLQFCDGGHCTPYLIRGSQVSTVQTSKHLPIGIFEEAEYTDRQITLTYGETLVLYTDGITEAENANGEMFGKERLLETLEAGCQMGPERMIAMLHERVMEFANGYPQSDDIAVMFVQFDKKC